MESRPPDPSIDPCEAALAAAAAAIEAGEWTVAEAALAPLFATDPLDPEANLLRGLIERGRGHLAAAEESLRSVLRSDGAHPVAWQLLAEVLAQRGNPLEAARASLRAWQLDRGRIDLARAAATSLVACGELESAVEPARAAAELGGGEPAAIARLAKLLQAIGREDEAMAACERGLASTSTRWPLLMVRAVLRLPAMPRDEAEAGAAVARYRSDIAAAAQELRGEGNDSADDADPHGGGASRFSGTGSAIDALAAFEPEGLPWPFLRSAFCDPDRDELRQFGSVFATACERAADPVDPSRVIEVRPTSRLRIGVLSGLWHDHVVARLFLDGWLRHLDRTRFEVVAIDVGRVPDPYGASLLAQADRVEQGARPFAEWVRTIRGLECEAVLIPEVGIDPLVARLAAVRLAPVQAVAWGHPESTGLDAVGWFLSSDAMEPADGDDHYLEQLVRLPGLGVCAARPEIPVAAERERLGWSRENVVCWCAQTPHKHHPRCDRGYAEIAAAVPEARLVFLAPNEVNAATRFRSRLAEAFAAAGADPKGQLEFVSRLETREFRARLAAADLFFDPPGWSGGHTTLEAIAAGLPVLTLPGKCMRRRHALGILRTIDPDGAFRGDLIVASEAKYRDRAVELCRDESRRRRLGAAIAAAAARAFDDPSPIRALEAWLESAVSRNPAVR